MSCEHPATEGERAVIPFGGQPVPLGGFRVIPRHATTMLVHEPEVDLPEDISLFSGQPEPAEGFRVVLRHAVTVHVHQADVALRVGVLLICRKPVPAKSFGVVLRHSEAVLVHQAEIDLRDGVPLFGGPAEPSEGFRVVRCQATAALLVPFAKLVLRPRVSLLGQQAELDDIELFGNDIRRHRIDGRRRRRHIALIFRRVRAQVMLR